ISFPLVLLLCCQGGQTPAAPHTHSHTLPPCFVFFCLFDGCGLPPPCVIVEVGAVLHVSLPSSSASCCVDDVPPCASLLFCYSSTHTHKSSCTVLCKNALGDAGRWLASRAEMARPLRVCLRWESRCHWMDVCGMPFALSLWPADAAARCPPCEKVLPALGVILLCPLFLLCRVRALLGVC
ncbi:ATPase, partial [Trypanosoma cruzi]